MKARSSVLQGARYDVYNYVQNNPGCSRRDVAKGTGLPMSSATARVKELIDEGFLIEPPGARVESSTGKRVRALVASPKSEGSDPVKRIKIEVILYRNSKGELGVEASIVGAPNLPLRGVKRKLNRKEITLSVPTLTDQKPMSSKGKVTEVRKAEIRDDAGLIIEGDYTILS